MDTTSSLSCHVLCMDKANRGMILIQDDVSGMLSAPRFTVSSAQPDCKAGAIDLLNNTFSLVLTVRDHVKYLELLTAVFLHPSSGGTDLQVWYSFNYSKLRDDFMRHKASNALIHTDSSIEWLQANDSRFARPDYHVISRLLLTLDSFHSSMPSFMDLSVD